MHGGPVVQSRGLHVHEQWMYIICNQHFTLVYIDRINIKVLGCNFVSDDPVKCFQNNGNEN